MTSFIHLISAMVYEFIDDNIIDKTWKSLDGGQVWVSRLCHGASRQLLIEGALLSHRMYRRKKHLAIDSSFIPWTCDIGYKIKTAEFRGYVANQTHYFLTNIN